MIASLFAVIALPAFAGVVHVPYAANVNVSGVTYTTQVWAGNRGASPRRFQTFFIGAGQDGTNREGATFNGVTVPANATSLLTGVAPANAVGMLEINGAPQVLISARIVPTGAAAGRIGASLPVISSTNLIAANTTVFLQDLRRDSEHVTDLVLVNLANVAGQDATCTVTAAAASGAALGSTSSVTVLPLSSNRLADFLATLGQAPIAGARLTLACDRPFYAFAVTYDTRDTTVQVIEPSQVLSSALVPPGGTAPPPGCPAGALCYSRPGTFFTQRPPAVINIQQFDVPPGNYRKVHFQVEVFHGGWGDTSDSGGLHSVFWLVRDRNFDLLGFSVFRKPTRNDVMFRHGMGLLADQKPKIFLPVEGIPGHTYLVDYTYDPGGRTLNYKLIDRTTGQTVIDHNDVPNINRLTMAPGQKLRADFGFNEGRNENEDAGYNWSYSNLVLEVFPE